MKTSQKILKEKLVKNRAILEKKEADLYALFDYADPDFYNEQLRFAFVDYVGTMEFKELESHHSKEIFWGMVQLRNFFINVSINKMFSVSHLADLFAKKDAYFYKKLIENIFIGFVGTKTQQECVDFSGLTFDFIVLHDFFSSCCDIQSNN